MKSTSFISYLNSIFGRKSADLFEMREGGVVLHHQRIDEFNALAEKDKYDKCLRCPAKEYRQDLPFWTGSHKNKPIMVISQDAGKGQEIGEVNTVFSLHRAYLDKDQYARSSTAHRRYLELFESLAGSKDFLDVLYITDVIKCAYSTDRTLDPAVCPCSTDILFEISEVNPKVIILMGIAAQVRFKETLKQSLHIQEFVRDDNFHLSSAISSRNGKEIVIRASKYNFENRSVFFIPHLNGNLHISKEYRDLFSNFRNDCLTAISQCSK